jgi:hypothetical protein
MIIGTPRSALRSSLGNFPSFRSIMPKIFDKIALRSKNRLPKNAHPGSISNKLSE